MTADIVFRQQNKKHQSGKKLRGFAFSESRFMTESRWVLGHEPQVLGPEALCSKNVHGDAGMKSNTEEKSCCRSHQSYITRPDVRSRKSASYPHTVRLQQ